MFIILTVYLLLVWLIFSRLKLVRWGWASGGVAVLIGAFILAVFMAMFNYLTPSGSFVVISRVVEVAPNVSGQVIAIPVETNVPVKAGTTLFKIDPAPFQYKVDQLEASLAGARQQALQLKANYEQASANVEGLTRQLAYHNKRLADYQQMAGDGAQSEFRLQDTQVQQETVQFQLQAAMAAQLNALRRSRPSLTMPDGSWRRRPSSRPATVTSRSWRCRSATAPRSIKRCCRSSSPTRSPSSACSRRTDSGPSSPARRSSWFSTTIPAASMRRRSRESRGAWGRARLPSQGRWPRSAPSGASRPILP